MRSATVHHVAETTDTMDDEKPAKQGETAPDQRLRKPLLYPAELRERGGKSGPGNRPRSESVAPSVPKIRRYTRGADGKRRRTPEYAAWADMIQRCTNPRNHAWDRYGGRGIRVCERWLESFDVFAADMGPRPPGGSIERVDVDGDYEPSNCVWADEVTQQRNRRDNRRVTIYGETMCLAAWAERAGLPRRTLSARLNNGWDPVVALETPRGVAKRAAHRRAGVTPRNDGRQRIGRSGYRGVHRRGRGWGAIIKIDGRQRWLGTFSIPEEAARAYDAAAREHHGDCADLNFPEDAAIARDDREAG